LISEKNVVYKHYILDQLYRYTDNLITLVTIDWLWINKKRKKKKSNS
jgi:hypothetical protein